MKTKGTVPKQSAHKVRPYFNSLKIALRVEEGTGGTGEKKSKTVIQGLHCFCMDISSSTAKQVTAGNVMWSRAAQGQSLGVLAHDSIFEIHRKDRNLVALRTGFSNPNCALSK